MMKGGRLAATLLAALCLVPTPSAHAEKLFDFAGKVALLDGLSPSGVTVKLQVDLDRNRKLDDFETLTARVSGDGSYKVSYDLDPKEVDFEFVSFALKLVAAFQERGFEALLDKGPLPVVLSFQREGYSTVVKRLTTLHDAPKLDVLLTPLRQVQCGKDACLSADGSVQFSGLPGGTGIARAYAQAYDPGDETPRFPGSFTDDQDNLLKSSGFAEINLHDEAGNEIHKLSSPASVRFEAKRASWHTMPDLKPNTGRIELPMYSFDREIGEWVREADGELTHEDGTPVAEQDWQAIRGGSYEGRVFVSFRTMHFSTFNCDEPIEARACVTGRIVSLEGKAVAGVQISVDGASYTGNAGVSFTGKDGRFASDVMKSESAGEDVDYNGRTGESFSAHVVATGTGVFVGETFTTPSVRGSVQISGSSSCRPGKCECLDLGDIPVKFEPPRSCEVTVSASFSGRHFMGSGGPLAAGDRVASAKVRGTLSGGVTPPQGLSAELCQDKPCDQGTADANGKVTFVVPVVGDAPSLQLDGDWLLMEGDTYHYYSGSVMVTGCAKGETKVSSTVELALDHGSMGGLGAFVDALGDGPSVSDDDEDGEEAPDPSDLKDSLDCGCRVWRGPSRGFGAAGLLAGLSLLGVLWRRRSRK